MRVPTPWIGRRDTLIGLSAAVAAQLLPSVSARGQVNLPATPRQTEGPFYPRDWQGDADNDLVVVRGEPAKALGQVMHIEGRVLEVSGRPIAGAAVEIWQCDARGIYFHPAMKAATAAETADFRAAGAR